MRLTAIFLLAACLQVHARGYGQTISLSETNTSLLRVFKEIKKQSGYEFFYEDRLMQKARLVSIHVQNAPLDKVLGMLFKDQALSYEIIGKTVAIREKEVAAIPLSPPPIDVHGRILNEKGEPVAGATVGLKGTKKAVVTGDNGEFTIQADPGQVLVISYVGYGTREVVVSESNASNLSLSLKISNQVINEVVVTALGVKKERKALGYSVTEVKGEELTQAREVNVLNSLEGKVAGLNVSSVAGGPGASSNVTIRGVSSISQTNQPLYVINGIPVENTPNGNMGTQYDNAPDLGDAMGNINPDDIETISVLKGAAATALYGYRGKAGVILITTKSAKNNSIEFNSNYVAEHVVNPTDWQYVYGQGGNNVKPSGGTSAFTNGQYSYGAKLDGQPAPQFDSVSRPYIAQKNNMNEFYRLGGTFTNTVAMNRVFDGGSIRFSASDLTNQSIVPNSGLNRQSFNLAANFSPYKHLTIDARVNYILEQAKNRPFLSDGPGNSNFNVFFLPTSLDVNTLKKATNADGSELSYSNNAYATNPWFAAEKFINNTDRDRLISSVNLRYTFNNGLFLQGRAGRDAYTDRYFAVVPNGTAYRPLGSITDQTTKFTDMNVDGLAGITIKAGPDLTITPNVGAAYRRTKSTQTANTGTTFAVPYVYNIDNAINKSVGLLPRDLETQSVYGNVELAYAGFLYLNGSIRNDWFSSLATAGKSNKVDVLYPSISGSFVFSQMLHQSWLSFGKLRAGYAEVGQATDPYQTLLSYALYSPTLNGRPLGSISNTSVPNDGLMASKASEVEVGTEMKLFNNLLSVDVSWYFKKSNDEIVSAPASISSGYTGAILNIGQLQNKGVEALVSVTPIKGKFSWTSSVNGSVNNNKVVALAAGQSSLAIGTSRTGNGFTQNIVGYAAAQVVAFDYKYDNAGKIVLDASGVPVQGDLKPFGSAYAKWVAGWNNEFTLGRFNFSFLIDGKWGAKIFSATDYYGYIFGLHKATLVNREGTFGSNLNAQTYYTSVANNISKLFVQDASFIKFRQIVVGYSFPAKLFGNVVKGATLSLVARNLFTLMKRTDNIDPEANYSVNAQGLELGGVPPTRTFGANLSFKL
ncbi:MAG TPA: SusC/RagA family TonB-linked outer membrane protein [Puia sp.]|nr:SusC/RagA family TonB-linked outer membrane protein [Puia sp.]